MFKVFRSFRVFGVSGFRVKGLGFQVSVSTQCHDPRPLVEHLDGVRITLSRCRPALTARDLNFQVLGLYPLPLSLHLPTRPPFKGGLGPWACRSFITKLAKPTGLKFRTAFGMCFSIR